MHALVTAVGGGGEGPPESIFGLLWHKLNDHYAGRTDGWWHFMGFDNHDRHLGMHWFEAIGFAILTVAVLGLCAFLATRQYRRIPRGIQNVMELLAVLLRKLVVGMVGPHGEKYLPYLGSLFLFIFTMNLIGILPGFRSPTMTLSTTLALGFTTFFVVQGIAVRVNGPLGYVKHFLGDIPVLALLMLVVHFFGEIAKPVSLSLRLYGNIFGEDSIIEKLIHMGGWIPLQFPMMLFAIFTSFLQAFIFTSLSCIYIASMTEHAGHEEHGESHAH